MTQLLHAKQIRPTSIWGYPRLYTTIKLQTAGSNYRYSISSTHTCVLVLQQEMSIKLLTYMLDGLMR